MLSLKDFSTKMKALLLIIALAAVSAMAAPKWHQLDATYSFERYMKDFRKSYVPNTEEYDMRKLTFTYKLQQIIAFNKEGHSWKKGVNHMTDWSPEELRSLKGRLPEGTVAQPAPERVYTAQGLELPDSIDYRQSGSKPVLTAVKDQGQCGSCWAHASTESVESHFAMATGELYVLSQQQLTSCVNNSVLQCGGTGGCNGATAQLGWDYLVKSGGQVQEWVYGYTSYFGDSGVCSLNSTIMPAVVELTGHTEVERNSDAAVAEALVTKGPLAISVDASSWPDYESGVFAGCDYANNISMDHAVQLIGYGFDNKTQESYWLVRNSWSAIWGEDGFIRLKRTTDCGWNINWTTNGGGCLGEPVNVWSCGMCGILYDTGFPNIVAGAQTAEKSGPSKGVIAGAVVGGVAGAAVIGAILFKVLSSGNGAKYAGEDQDLLNQQQH